MFDLAWSEIALIGVVALVAIGPKDMPVAIKTVATMLKKARRMAAEFQTHVDEMVREADLHEVRDHINEIRSLDIKGKILNAVDSDGSIRRTIHDRPFNPAPPPVTPVAPEAAVTPAPSHEAAAPEPAPAFVPPPDAVAHAPDVAAEPPPMIPPAFAHSRAEPAPPREPATHPAPHA